MTPFMEDSPLTLKKSVKTKFLLTEKKCIFPLKKTLKIFHGVKVAALSFAKVLEPSYPKNLLKDIYWPELKKLFCLPPLKTPPPLMLWELTINNINLNKTSSPMLLVLPIVWPLSPKLSMITSESLKD